MQIRYYQEESVLALYSYFAKSTGNPIIALPTGTGKSVVIAEWLRSIFTYFPGQRVMILTHVKELIAQNYKKLINVWPLAPAGIYSAGLGRKEVRPITFAGIASVVKKAADFSHVDMVIIDECHLVSPHDETSYQNFIADLKKVNPHLKVIGLTATPYRLGQGLLTMPIETSKGPRPSLFSDICYDMTGLEPFNRLIAEGFLCQLIPKRVKAELDVSRVKNIGGDYNLGELQLAVDREEITRRALDEAEVQVAEAPHASGKARVRWLVFATGIEHTEHVARELTGRGYKAFAVHSKTPEKLRDKAVEWFTEESDDLRIIVNNGVFTTGFDCPHLDVIIMLRPTNSPGLWVQMLGRGTRPYPGKDNCLVLDFAGNTKRLGPINDPIIPKRKGKKGGGDAPVKVCEACGCYNHASVRFCINCNTEFPKAVKFKDTADTAEVVKGSAPVIEIFPVSHVEYAPHFPPPNSPKPPSLKVTYSCGKYQKFSEWVCLEHGGYVEGKARHWWAMSTKSAELRGPPKTVEEALTRLDSLREPSHIRVWMNDRHPRVMDRDFSGTAFNTAGKPEKLANMKTPIQSSGFSRFNFCACTPPVWFFARAFNRPFGQLNKTNSESYEQRNHRHENQKPCQERRHAAPRGRQDPQDLGHLCIAPQELGPRSDARRSARRSQENPQQSEHGRDAIRLLASVRGNHGPREYAEACRAEGCQEGREESRQARSTKGSRKARSAGQARRTEARSPRRSDRRCRELIRAEKTRSDSRAELRFCTAYFCP